jgi:fumarylacetoacetase
VFAEAGTYVHWRGGVAIGDQVLDLAALHGHKLLNGLAAALETAVVPGSKIFGLNAFMATWARKAWRALRHALFALLRRRRRPPRRQRCRPA